MRYYAAIKNHIEDEYLVIYGNILQIVLWEKSRLLLQIISKLNLQTQ